jgi:hypothetical protein
MTRLIQFSREAVVRVVTTVLELVGIAAIVAGVAFIFWPAAFIVAGVGILLVSRGLSR